MADLRNVFVRQFAKSKPAVAAASLIAACAYGSTLLPGLDLGDTAAFQTLVNLPVIVPRHAYPLYFALGKLFVWLTGGSNPALAMNLLSACAGAAAIGASAWVGWLITASRLAGFWSALLLAFSYTFWSQAVIAEVYTLEALFVALVFGALLRWWQQPTAGSLAVLYSLYALSFGNHLSMILFAPALVWILWRGRLRSAIHPFSAGGVALALAIAVLGALQYAWNFYGLWTLSTPRPEVNDLLSTFWFDVTKTDWRESLVGTVPLAQWWNRLAMYWWDLRQQFGLVGIGIAVIGAGALARASRDWLVALVLAWSATFAFAFLYNVGDAHAFLLPSHQVVVMFAALGASVLVRMANGLRAGARALAVVLLCAVPVWRGFDTWPAVDRSEDVRPAKLAAAAIQGLDSSSSVYVGDLNWQVQNAVEYEIATRRPEMPRVFSSSVLWHFDEFVHRNHALGRDVVLTRSAASTIEAVYGTRFRLERDPRAAVSTLDDLPPAPPGSPYVLAVLTPLPGVPFDRERIARVARALGGQELPQGRYAVMSGVVGAPPVLRLAADRPFWATARLPFGRLRFRIDAWLPADTMRRAGFGHIITNGRHALTLERGATLGIFDQRGHLAGHAYEGGSFSLEPRFRIPVLR